MKIKKFYDLYYPNNIILYNHQINKITDNSKEVSLNDVFICIKGYKNDGHDYIEEAVSKGCKTIIINENHVYFNENINIIRSKNPLKDFARMVILNYEEKGLKKPKFIGVTGTNGKTTITNILYEFLKTKKLDILLIGTNGIKKYYGLKEELIKADNTTPNFNIIYDILSTVPLSFDYVIMEVSSQGIIEGRTLGIDFDIVVVNSLSNEHLDYHHTINEYRDSKAFLVSSISQNKDSILILNDNLNEFSFFNNLNINKTIYYGSRSNNNVFYFLKELDIDKTKFCLVINKIPFYLETNLIGDFNIENICAVVSILMSLNFELTSFFAFLKDVPKIDGRLNIIKHQNRYFIIDFGHNSEAVYRVLSFFNMIKKNNLITVIGCGGNRDKEKRPVMARTACLYSDHVIFTEDNSRNEDVNQIINDMVSNLDYNNYSIELDRFTAIQSAYQKSSENDFILILGKGNENYLIKNNSIINYSDEASVKKIINK